MKFQNQQKKCKFAMLQKIDNMLRRNIVIHVLCWGIVLFFPLFFYSPTDTTYVALRRFVKSLGSPLSYMLLFYANYLVLIPKLLFKDKKNLFFVVNVVLVALAIAFMVGWWHAAGHLLPTDDLFFGRRRGPRPPHWGMYFQNAIMNVLIVGLSVAVRMGQQWQHAEEMRREAEKAQAESELSNLRNQLNPHFLLNTLNNIYALIAFNSDKAQTAVEDLSKLLRYVLYDNQQDRVPIYKEMEFMHNYIELMKIRVTNNVDISTDIAVAPGDTTPIAPLIFISLIENAFKHGISPRPGESYIKIAIKNTEKGIACEIRNSNHPKKQNDKSGSGIGLTQVQRRLELNYPGQYEWEKGVTADGKEYYSKIVIYHDSEVRDS